MLQRSSKQVIDRRQDEEKVKLKGEVCNHLIASIHMLIASLHALTLRLVRALPAPPPPMLKRVALVSSNYGC